jgi:hypothetical protein
MHRTRAWCLDVHVTLIFLKKISIGVAGNARSGAGDFSAAATLCTTSSRAVPSTSHHLGELGNVKANPAGA